MAVILENYYDFTKEMLERHDIFSVVTPIMIESENYEKEKDTDNKVLNGACQLFASISSVQVDLKKIKHIDSISIQHFRKEKFKCIAQIIVNQTGLIRQFCLNLGSLRDGQILKSIVQTIGNLANIKEIQENEFLLKGGIDSIIGYMLGQKIDNKDDSEAVKKQAKQIKIHAARTIFLLAQT